MTPEEEKALYDALMDKIKELTAPTTEHTKEIESSLARGLNLIKEWSTATEDVLSLPQEIKDLKNSAHYSLWTGITGTQNIMTASTGIDMAIEAAFNLGKANVPKG